MPSHSYASKHDPINAKIVNRHANALIIKEEIRKKLEKKRIADELDNNRLGKAIIHPIAEPEPEPVVVIKPKAKPKKVVPTPKVVEKSIVAAEMETQALKKMVNQMLKENTRLSNEIEKLKEVPEPGINDYVIGLVEPELDEEEINEV